ncbi:MAG: hypothetical protein K9M10_00075 [Candidatus Pacebacteria bacterium]|nr:hypothetical protein [Candidatus Paceibacterota bacterium]MCF7856862.1 hypothetical protein [Candidatus Paceibacterota bacterium]
MQNKIAIAYVPILHQGYFSFLKTLEEEGVKILYLVSDDILMSHEELDYINRKDRIRALPHEVMKQQLSLLTTMTIDSLTSEKILFLKQESASLVMPREDVNLFLAETYFAECEIEYLNIFLRINRENSGEGNIPEHTEMASSEFERSTMALVVKEATKSADWWKQVGAVLVKDGKAIFPSHNEHMPDEEIPNVFGDLRSLYKKGVNINYSTAAHAEIGVIAEAARQGISTQGAEFFVTDFPCPYCSRLIAKSGIKKVYYLKGYAVLEGDEFFKQMGVETVKVDVSE